MWRWLGVVVVALVLTGVWLLGVVGFPHGTGYFAPLFAPDGRSVLAIRRDTAAFTAGFGYEFFTPPATVFIRSDHYALVRVALADHRVTVLGDVPGSPFIGHRLQAYHGAIFGSSSAHLRWEHGQLSYAVAVTRYDQPQSRTFAARGHWDEQTRRVTETPTWRPAPDISGGDEPEQLFRNLEVVALPGSEGLPCGLVTLDRDSGTVTPLVMTTVCRSKYPSGPSLTDVKALSRRHDIERALEIKQTYAGLVAARIAAGASEGTAMLQANKDMERLGYFPRSPTLTATRERCPDGEPVFTISEEEFRVGLFQDIEQAIAHPGDAIDKGGEYIRHQQFDTSRLINEYLTDRSHTTFVVKRSTTCWRMRIDR